MKSSRVWPLLAVFGILASALTASATVPAGYVNVYANRFQDATGTLIANATASFCPVNNSGVPISFQLSGLGAVSQQCVTALITSGVMSIQLADSALTVPVNLVYALTVTDNVSGKVLVSTGYSSMQPSGFPSSIPTSSTWCTVGYLAGPGGTCDIDLYTPNLAALAVTVPGPPGPQGPAGAVNIRGAWSATTAYAVGDAYFYAGSLYVVTTAYTSGGSFGGTDTADAASLATGCAVTGCTFTTSPTLPGNPSATNMASNKGYVDSSVAAETTRAEAAESTNATAISTETTRATGAESTNATAISTETTRATAAEATKLNSSGALNALLPGTTQSGSGTSNAIVHPGSLALGGTACPSGLLAGTGCSFGWALSTATIGAGANQLPAASTFALSLFNPIYMIGDGATPCDATVGGGTYTVPVFTDGVSWHSIVQCSNSTSGGGTGSTAVVEEWGTLSAANSVAATVPGGSGNTPGKKIETNCATGYGGSATTPTGVPDGHRYCTSSQQTTGEAAGGPTEGTITVTQTGAGSVSVVNGNGSGGSDAPSAVTTNYGVTTYDSTCPGDATATAPTGIAGLNPPACGTNVSALLSETTDGTYGGASVLWPTSWPASLVDVSDHLYRDLYLYVPTLSNQTRIEFDDNESASTGRYYGFGFSYSITNNRFEFLPQANKFVGHGTCSGTWCPVTLNVAPGYTAMSGCSGTTCTLTSAHWYHIRKFEHRESTSVTGSSSVPTLFYDQFCIADVTAGATAMSCYNEVDPATSKQPEGYEVNYGWPQAFDTQWQLYQNTTSSTSQIEIDNDVIVAYQIAAGSGGAGFSQNIADLGRFNYDSSSLTTNSDTSAGDTSTMTATGSPGYETTNEESGAGAALFATFGTYEKVTFPSAQNTLYSRFYLNSPTLSTDSTGAARIFEIFNGSGGVFELYVNNSAKTIVAENLATSATCAVTTAALTATLTANNWNYIDVYWTEGSSTSNGAYTVLWNGVAPADTNCNKTGVNTGYSGTYPGATYVESGYITDSGSNQNWDFEIDNLAFSDSQTLGAITFGSSSYTVYRCTTAGTLPVGALTTVTSECGAYVATGLTSN